MITIDSVMKDSVMKYQKKISTFLPIDTNYPKNNNNKKACEALTSWHHPPWPSFSVALASCL